ncbi:hypothetical protein AVEN_201500-1 [Araneus ventricosus]|uniref:Uncharacterized protein n=1 Tax=Araneus ventricosus TaxID=182803 RepID=A0A4Y2SIU6_ARAVE|nr:hypothetical protein AVEN_201500-1 [Araneus ventricosus]
MVSLGRGQQRILVVHLGYSHVMWSVDKGCGSSSIPSALGQQRVPGGPQMFFVGTNLVFLDGSSIHTGSVTVPGTTVNSVGQLDIWLGINRLFRPAYSYALWCTASKDRITASPVTVLHLLRPVSSPENSMKIPSFFVTLKKDSSYFFFFSARNCSKKSAQNLCPSIKHQPF